MSRLKEKYNQDIRPGLKKTLGFNNLMQVPEIKKITLNMGVGEILQDKNIQSAKIAGAILDIKERSNKDGKKYAFVTVSNQNCQFEMSIFNDAISLYKNFLKKFIFIRWIYH